MATKYDVVGNYSKIKEHRVPNISDTIKNVGNTASNNGDTIKILGDTVPNSGDTIKILGDEVLNIGDTVPARKKYLVNYKRVVRFIIQNILSFCQKILCLFLLG